MTTLSINLLSRFKFKIRNHILSKAVVELLISSRFDFRVLLRYLTCQPFLPKNFNRQQREVFENLLIQLTPSIPIKIERKLQRDKHNSQIFE